MHKLYTVNYWDPHYQQWQTLDCPAETREAALASARAFLLRINARREHVGAPADFLVRVPETLDDVVLEEPRPPVPAEQAAA